MMCALALVQNGAGGDADQWLDKPIVDLIDWLNLISELNKENKKRQ